jgi:hypothetical protein
MLVRLKLQADPRFKLDGFEVSRDAQRGKDDMSVDVAPLGHEVDGLIRIGVEANNHNVLTDCGEVASCRERVEAPFGSPDAPLDAIGQLGRSRASTNAHLSCHGCAERIEALRTIDQPGITPRSNIDELQHVSSLAPRGSSSLDMPTRAIWTGKMKHAFCNSDLVAATTRGPIAYRVMG